MRHNLTLLAFLAVTLVLPIAAYGYTGGAGLQDSPHDFVVIDHANEMGIASKIIDPSKSTESVLYQTGEPGAVGLCNFCHTPHRAIQTSLLWNHTLPVGAVYTWNDADQTVGGTALPTNIASWAGPSKLCLSCHDGTVAIGDLNWYQAKARTGTSKLSGGRASPPQETDLLNRSGEMSKYNIADGITAGSMNGNHPVAVPYPFSQVANTYNGITTGEGVVLGTEFASNPIGSGIRLYRMTGGGQVVVAIPTSYSGTDVGIECGSCHDVHNGATVKPDPITNRPRLVRGTVYGDGPGGTTAFAGGDDDYLCVKCHKK